MLYWGISLSGNGQGWCILKHKEEEEKKTKVDGPSCTECNDRSFVQV